MQFLCTAVCIGPGVSSHSLSCSLKGSSPRLCQEGRAVGQSAAYLPDACQPPPGCPAAPGCWEHLHIPWPAAPRVHLPRVSRGGVQTHPHQWKTAGLVAICLNVVSFRENKISMVTGILSNLFIATSPTLKAGIRPVLKLSEDTRMPSMHLS